MKILIVDDSPMSSKHIKNSLQKFGKCEIAADGKEAYELFLTAYKNNVPYDIISMDINMPCWNGDQAIEAMRIYETVFNKTLSKIIVISANLSSKLVLNLFKAGTSYCLKKPLNEQDLIKIMKDIVSSQPTSSDLRQMVLGQDDLLVEE